MGVVRAFTGLPVAFAVGAAGLAFGLGFFGLTGVAEGFRAFDLEVVFVEETLERVFGLGFLVAAGTDSPLVCGPESNIPTVL